MGPSAFIRVLLALTFVAVQVCASHCAAQSIPSRMDAIVRSYVDQKQFMGSVLVAEKGDVVFEKSYGFANLEWNEANASSTKYRLGSLTKQFTAASVLLLEERGKLNTADPVKKYLPDAPAAWDQVTIYHLLTHTSGIPNFTDFPDYIATQATPTTPQALVGRFRDKPLDFAPGTQYRYSNSGYVVLGFLIEAISGKTYAQFLQENIFAPLHMAESGYDVNAAILMHRASGYVPSANAPVHAGYIDMTVPFSAGGLYSTTPDLLRWQEALFGGHLLSASSLKKMTTPYRSGYACGLAVHTVAGRTVVEHAGGINGFNTQMAYYSRQQGGRHRVSQPERERPTGDRSHACGSGSSRAGHPAIRAEGGSLSPIHSGKVYRIL